MKARSLEGAILSAINLGGDADTVGACCGALSGAYWGVGAIPERWKRDLEDYKNILHCAEKLWNCAEQFAADILKNNNITSPRFSISLVNYST